MKQDKGWHPNRTVSQSLVHRFPSLNASLKCTVIKPGTPLLDDCHCILRLLARIPANASGRTSWRAIIGSLAVTLSTWTLMLSCLRICCRQKAGKRARISCTLLHRWVRDCGDVFFTFPLMGVKVVLDKMIVSPLTVAQAALLRRRAAQTLRLQDQLLAEGGNTPGAGRKRERASTGSLPQRIKRKSTAREKPKEPASRSSAATRPRLVPDDFPEPSLPLSPPDEEEPAVDEWCQVHRHSEHPKRALPAERSRPAETSKLARACKTGESAPSRSQLPTRKVSVHCTVDERDDGEGGELLDDAPQVESSSSKPIAIAAEVAPQPSVTPPSPRQTPTLPRISPAPPLPVAAGRGPSASRRPLEDPRSAGSSPCVGAPPDAPLPPTQRPNASDPRAEPRGNSEDAEMPVILTPLAPPPLHPPKLSGTAEPSAELQCEEAQDEEDSEPRRPPPPDMPPPPCPAGQEILRWLQQPPKGETAVPVVADMGCFSGGTGGTPGWDGGMIQSCDKEETIYDQLPWKSECPGRFPAEDDVGKRLEAMVEELAGPSSFELLEDAFSKVDAARARLDASLQKEREELAIRHHEILQELHQLVQRNELLKSEATNRWTPDVTDKMPADSVDAVKLTEMDLAQVQRTKSDEPSSVGRKMAEFHVIRVQGQTKVLRDPVSVEDTDVKRRDHASRFERMGSASSGVLKAEAPKGIFKFVFDPMFETVICVLIVINSIVMSFEAQHAGLTLGYDLGIRTYNAPGTELWPGAAEVFVASEWFFGPIFAAELILKVIGMKCQFLRDFWNYFDTIMVVAWFVDTVFSGLLPVDPMLLRLARLARLLRLMRLVRKLKGFDALYILTTALRGSVTVLLWSFLMLFLLQLMFALFLQRVVSDSIESNIASEVLVAESNELFLYFGTCSRCLLTMFEITLGNWPPVARLLQDHVSEAFTAFSIIHKITIGYALIAVINGVFLKETFQAADNDDKIMMRNTEKKRHQHIKKMKSLFEAADETGDGVLDREEFIQVMTDPEIVNWLAAMDLHISDPNMVFDMVQEDGGITAEQLVKGVSRLKGSARSTDLHLLTLDVKKLFFLVQDLFLGQWDSLVCGC
ncbi:Scn10a [Symbiodinium sp. CCMP2456]|nr:Scn10a [Symbiodinium sp. CCMP2456]